MNILVTFYSLLLYLFAGAIMTAGMGDKGWTKNSYVGAVVLFWPVFLLVKLVKGVIAVLKAAYHIFIEIVKE